ncbi:MAG TPA: orotidine-5'-phosphate decarboxylase [Longimicrobiales bacterium]|nr:orotidine-5'-phosphate decarboxylase [Longimicrobiales bacterium]
MSEIIVALDLPSAEHALDLVDGLGESVDIYKVGSPLFTRSGPQFVAELRARGKRVFLDLKYHDIPSTVANAVESAAQLDVELLTLHASGGEAMMRAARDVVGDDGPRLLGVTILTSFTAVDVEQVWSKEIISVRDEVARLTSLAVDAGLHGVVASPLEVESLKRRHGAGLIVVTPGIRPAGDGLGDQVRTATPADAARAGSDFLVIGRPVLKATDPLAVVRAIRADLDAAPGVVS